MEESTETKLDSTRPDQTSRKSSDVLTKYDQLLEHFVAELNKAPVNPYASVLQKSFWRRSIRSDLRDQAGFLAVPNTLMRDLVGGNLILQELEGLDD
jgi:hypothetical protein